MRRLLLPRTSLLFLSVLLLACGSGKQPAEPQAPDSGAAPTVAKPADPAVTKPVDPAAAKPADPPRDRRVGDLLVRPAADNPLTAEFRRLGDPATVIASVPDVDPGNRRVQAELRGRDLWVIRYPSGLPQLWRYTDGTGTRLVDASVRSFSADPPGEGIAVLTEDKLLLLSKRGGVERDLIAATPDFPPADPLEAYEVAGWNAAGDAVWILSGSEAAAYRIRPQAVTATMWKLPGDVNLDYALEPATGRLVWSDCPAIQDAEDGEAFARSGRVIRLRLRDLAAGTETGLARLTARCHEPRLLSPTELEVAGPDGGRRILPLPPAAAENDPGGAGAGTTAADQPLTVLSELLQLDAQGHGPYRITQTMSSPDGRYQAVNISSADGGPFYRWLVWEPGTRSVLWPSLENLRADDLGLPFAAAGFRADSKAFAVVYGYRSLVLEMRTLPDGDLLTSKDLDAEADPEQAVTTALAGGPAAAGTP